MLTMQWLFAAFNFLCFALSLFWFTTTGMFESISSFKWRWKLRGCVNSGLIKISYQSDAIEDLNWQIADLQWLAELCLASQLLQHEWLPWSWAVLPAIPAETQNAVRYYIDCKPKHGIAYQDQGGLGIYLANQGVSSYTSIKAFKLPPDCCLCVGFLVQFHITLQAVELKRLLIISIMLFCGSNSALFSNLSWASTCASVQI